jgi:hypothetical protein
VTADGVAANEALQTVTGAAGGWDVDASLGQADPGGDADELTAALRQARATIARVAAVMADSWDGNGGRVNDWTRLRAVRNALAGEQP